MKKNLLKWLKEIIIAIIIIAVVLNVVSFLKKPDLLTDELASFELISIEKKLISSNDYANKPILIHFWATWCPTCKLEASTIQKLSKTASVITVAVSSGSDSEIKNFMQERELDFTVVNDNDGKFASKFSVTAFPTTFIYDKFGKIAFSEVGYSSLWGLKLRLWLTD